MAIAIVTTTPAALSEKTETVDLAEQAIIDGCLQGSRRAIEALYHRFSERVYHLAARMVGHQDADEVAQDVFFRIFRGLTGFRRDAALSTWVYRITMNVCFSHLERRKRRTRLDTLLRDADPPGSRVTSQGAPLLRQKLQEALDALPAGYRAVLVLHDVEGLSHDEIGSVLDCRTGTSKSQLHKARMRMREILGPALSEQAASE